MLSGTEFLLLRREISSLSSFMEHVETTDPMWKWKKPQCEELGRLIDNIRSMFSSDIINGRIPGPYLSIFRLLVSAFSLQHEQVQQSLSELREENDILVRKLTGSEVQISKSQEEGSLRLQLIVANEKIMKLERKMRSENSLKKNATIEALKKALSDREGKLENANQKIEELNERIRELKVKNLKETHVRFKFKSPDEEVLNNLASKYESQASELMEVGRQKSDLLKLIHRLLQLAQNFELTQNERTQIAEPELLNVLNEIDTKTVQDVCNGEGSLVDKTKRIVRLVNRSLSEKQEMTEALGVMRGALFGQLKFMDALVSDRKLMDCIIDKQASEEEAMFLVKSQLKSVREVIANHAGYGDWEPFFARLVSKSGSVDDILKNLAERNDLKEYNIFILLLQAVAANNILRKLIQDLEGVIQEQTRDLRQARNMSAELNRQKQAEIKTIIREREDRLQKTLDCCKSIMRRSILLGDATEEIYDDLNLTEELAIKGTNITDREYIESLQQQTGELRNQVKLLEEEKASIQKQAKKDFSTVQKYIEKLKTETKDEREKEELMKDKLVKQMQDLEQRFLVASDCASTLKGDNDMLIAECKNIKEQHSEYENQVQQIVIAIRREISNVRSETLELLDGANAQLGRAREYYLQESQYAEEVKKKSLEDLETFERLKNELSEQIVSLKKKNWHLKRELKNALSESKMLSTKLEQVEETLPQLRVKLGNMTAMMSGKNREDQRLTQLRESQARIQLMALTTEYERKYESAKRSIAESTQSFLVYICKLFSNYVDVSLPITMDNVRTILEKVDRDLRLFPKLKNSDAVLSQIKSHLLIEDNERVVQKVEQTIEEMDDMKSKLSKLDDASPRLMEVESWIRRVFQLCYKDKNPGLLDVDGPQMQRFIESAIRSQISK